MYKLRLFGTTLILDLGKRGLLAPDWGDRLEKAGIRPSTSPIDAMDLEPMVNEILYLLRISDEPPNPNYPGYQCRPPDENS
jgi:hypothetical protein